MNMRTILSVAALVVSVSLVKADILSEVSKSQQDELAQGQVVVNSQTVSGAPWPRLMLYQVIDAPPKVLWDLFNDYAAAPSYTPNLISATVVAENPDGSKDVQYTVKVPVIQKATYTVRNTYTKKGDMRDISWTLLKSPLAKSSDGSLRFEPYGNKQSLLCYTNLVVPITNLVAGLKNQALQEAKTTVQAIKTEAERRAKP